MSDDCENEGEYRDVRYGGMSEDEDGESNAPRNGTRENRKLCYSMLPRCEDSDKDDKRYIRDEGHSKHDSTAFPPGPGICAS